MGGHRNCVPNRRKGEQSHGGKKQQRVSGKISISLLPEAKSTAKVVRNEGGAVRGSQLPKALESEIEAVIG